MLVKRPLHVTHEQFPTTIYTAGEEKITTFYDSLSWSYYAYKRLSIWLKLNLRLESRNYLRPFPNVAYKGFCSWLNKLEENNFNSLDYELI